MPLQGKDYWVGAKNFFIDALAGGGGLGQAGPALEVIGYLRKFADFFDNLLKFQGILNFLSLPYYSF